MIFVPGTPLFSQIHQKCHVTGSTCAAAIGIGKYKTRQQLKIEKLQGPSARKPVSDYQQAILDYGMRFEETAIKVASFVYKNIQHPAPFSYLLGDQRYGATPDGLIGQKALLEVKCPFKQQIYKELLIEPPEQPYVPVEHFVQVMMELACHQREVGVYVCWTPKRTAIVHVHFDMDIWEEIYGHLLRFSQALESAGDDNGQLKRGQKEILKAKFTEYSKRSSEFMFFINTDPPIWS